MVVTPDCRRLVISGVNLIALVTKELQTRVNQFSSVYHLQEPATIVCSW